MSVYRDDDGVVERLLKRLEQAIYDLGRRGFSESSSSSDPASKSASPSAPVVAAVRLDSPLEVVVTDTVAVESPLSVSVVQASPIRVGVIPLGVNQRGSVRPDSGNTEHWEVRAIYVSGMAAVHRIYGTGSGDRFDDVYVSSGLDKFLGLQLLVNRDYYLEIENRAVVPITAVYEAVVLTL